MYSLLGQLRALGYVDEASRCELLITDLKRTSASVFA
jgi:hypothetical protein